MITALRYRDSVVRRVFVATVVVSIMHEPPVDAKYLISERESIVDNSAGNLHAGLSIDLSIYFFIFQLLFKFEMMKVF